MSRSPLDAADQGELAAYQAGWTALNTLLSHGGSMSGHERNCVFLNCRSEIPRFANASAVSGLDFPDDARGIALTDWDQDGDIDLWMSNRTSPRLRLMSNGWEGGPAESLALHLQGTDCNRDAIGARVEVKLQDAAQPLTATLHAGEGYLSQSSKWLHIGLGRGATVERVAVHWPGGRQEQFQGVAAGARYVLRQGTGKAVPWLRPGAGAVLRPGENPAQPASAVAQVFLPRPIPMPRIEYTVGSETKAVTSEGDGAPLLLLLYASWCPHCQSELRELTDHAERIRHAGLKVLALSVDELQMDPAAEDGHAGAADALMRRLGFPFATGQATSDALARLTHLEDALFEIRSDFAVPMGYLLDGQRHLVAIHRGPAPLEALLSDVEQIARGESAMRDAAIPFPGNWYTLHPGRPALLELLADHFQQPFPEDSIRYLEMSLAELSEPGAIDHVRGRVAGL
ncbi:MAG: ASPIC/UnbV domain-containing protein, partial [Verrucomicrobiales bacterium]